MTSILVFNFVVKKCIPQIMILFILEFFDYLKDNYFLTIFLWICGKPKKTNLYT